MTVILSAWLEEQKQDLRVDTNARFLADISEPPLVKM